MASRRAMELDLVRALDHGPIDMAKTEKSDSGKSNSDRPGNGSGPCPLLYSLDEESKAALHYLDFLHRTKDVRAAIIRTLDRPVSIAQGRQDRSCAAQPDTIHLSLKVLKYSAGPIPNAVFRSRLQDVCKDPGGDPKHIRNVLAAQLLHVDTTRDLLRIAGTAFQSNRVAVQLAASALPIARALYRCRPVESDGRILKALDALLWRFDHLKIQTDVRLLGFGLRFAARARSLKHMKKYLQVYREIGRVMTKNELLTIIAKFSIGNRGLGEIRNGRWKQSELLQVLTGFQDCTHLPPEKQYHLGTFVDRRSWCSVHAWVAALARCRDHDTIWHEWERFRLTDMYRRPRPIRVISGNWTTSMRAEVWFVEQLVFAGDIERAWRIFNSSSASFSRLKHQTRIGLLDHPEYVLKWTESVREELLNKYDFELYRIENALGVQWQRGENDGSGFHILKKDQEEVLDELGADDWKLDVKDYGFPYDDNEVPVAMQESERRLHDAEGEYPAG